jgi:hypothetical protein
VEQYDIPSLKEECSHKDLVEYCEKIEGLLNQKKMDNTSLKEELEIKKEKYVMRELEYRRIIEEL